MGYVNEPSTLLLAAHCGLKRKQNYYHHEIHSGMSTDRQES